jgi:ubiquinone biosynthesis protein
MNCYTINNIFTSLSTVAFLCKEYICYYCGRKKQDSIFNIIKNLSKTNIMYVKLLQASSTKSNIFTKEQLQYMSIFNDNVPYTNNDVDNSFKDTLDELTNHNIIMCNDEKPIKTGTISLVYKGIIDERNIIIKVARKNIVQQINNALYQIKIIVKLLLLFRFHIPFDIDDFLAQHHDLFLLQTNFLNEVSNLEKMKNNFKNIDTILIPEVYPEFTNTNNNMIVMDYIDGITLDEVSEIDKPTFVEISMKFFLKSLLFDRFYHSDFHPGNVLFITKPTHKLGIIDYGIMDSLTDNEQDAMFHLTKELAISDNFYESVKLMVDTLIQPQEIYQNLPNDTKLYLYKTVSDGIENSFSNGSMISPKDLNGMNTILKNYNLSIDASFCKFILALTILDSVTHKLGNDQNYITLLKRHGGDMFDMSLLEL